jgi:hypothetical protein
MRAEFTGVKFQKVCQMVGLNPKFRLGDIPLFEVHRARLPSEVFLEIHNDICGNHKAYDHVFENEEARFRLFAPVSLRRSSSLTFYPCLS